MRIPQCGRVSHSSAAGYAQALTLVEAFEQRGENLSRESVMHQTMNLKSLSLPLPLPGIRLDTNATEFYRVQPLPMMRFDRKQWVRFGDVLNE